MPFFKTTEYIVQTHFLRQLFNAPKMVNHPVVQKSNWGPESFNNLPQCHKGGQQWSQSRNLHLSDPQIPVKPIYLPQKHWFLSHFSCELTEDLGQFPDYLRLLFILPLSEVTEVIKWGHFQDFFKHKNLLFSGSAQTFLPHALQFFSLIWQKGINSLS
jgi:hypothetical protein